MLPFKPGGEGWISVTDWVLLWNAKVDHRNAESIRMAKDI